MTAFQPCLLWFLYPPKHFCHVRGCRRKFFLSQRPTCWIFVILVGAFLPLVFISTPYPTHLIPSKITFEGLNFPVPGGHFLIQNLFPSTLNHRHAIYGNMYTSSLGEREFITSDSFCLFLVPPFLMNWYFQQVFCEFWLIKCSSIIVEGQVITPV